MPSSLVREKGLAMKPWNLTYLRQRSLKGFRETAKVQRPSSMCMEEVYSVFKASFSVIQKINVGLHILTTSCSFSYPAEYRSASGKLARLTKCRIVSVRYRLAPQNTFPAPLTDLLLLSLSLLYEFPKSQYKTVPSHNVILASNSAGANLCFVLIQFLLEFNCGGDHRVLDLHGQRVSLPLPTGVATISGWLDQMDCFLSWREGGTSDILAVL